MNARLVRWCAGVAGCLALLGCGSDGASSVDGDPGVRASGGQPARGGAPSSAGAPAAPGSGGVPGMGGAAASGGAGALSTSGGNAGAAIAGRSSVSGAGGEGVAGAAGQAGGAGGRPGVGGQSDGGGGRGGSGHGGAGRGSGAYAGGGSGGQQSAGAGGSAGLGPEAPGGRVSGYGTVTFQINSRNQMVRLQTTMLVPPEPPPSGTLFLWPGLQPDGANFEPIDNGVLQPVLTWGPSCAPGKQPREYSTWWISGQYVNTYGSDMGYTGCEGGDIMSVDVGDTLTIDMALDGTVWTQTVTDEQTGKTVTYGIDMLGQAQNLAYFVIEEYSSAPVSEVSFSDTTLSFADPDTGDCKLTARGQTDYVSVPVPSADGKSCFIADIILRAQGID